jgi:hypothetical protein
LTTFSPFEQFIPHLRTLTGQLGEDVTLPPLFPDEQKQVSDLEVCAYRLLEIIEEKLHKAKDTWGNEGGKGRRKEEPANEYLFSSTEAASTLLGLVPPKSRATLAPVINHLVATTPIPPTGAPTVRFLSAIAYQLESLFLTIDASKSSGPIELLYRGLNDNRWATTPLEVFSSRGSVQMLATLNDKGAELFWADVIQQAGEAATKIVTPIVTSSAKVSPLAVNYAVAEVASCLLLSLSEELNNVPFSLLMTNRLLTELGGDLPDRIEKWKSNLDALLPPRGGESISLFLSCTIAAHKDTHQGPSECNAEGALRGFRRMRAIAQAWKGYLPPSAEERALYELIRARKDCDLIGEVFAFNGNELTTLSLDCEVELIERIRRSFYKCFNGGSSPGNPAYQSTAWAYARAHRAPDECFKKRSFPIFGTLYSFATLFETSRFSDVNHRVGVIAEEIIAFMACYFLEGVLEARVAEVNSRLNTYDQGDVIFQCFDGRLEIGQIKTVNVSEKLDSSKIFNLVNQHNPRYFPPLVLSYFPDDIPLTVERLSLVLQRPLKREFADDTNAYKLTPGATEQLQTILALGLNYHGILFEVPYEEEDSYEVIDIKRNRYFEQYVEDMKIRELVSFEGPWEIFRENMHSFLNAELRERDPNFPIINDEIIELWFRLALFQYEHESQRLWLCPFNAAERPEAKWFYGEED